MQRHPHSLGPEVDLAQHVEGFSKHFYTTRSSTGVPQLSMCLVCLLEYHHEWLAHGYSEIITRTLEALRLAPGIALQLRLKGLTGEYTHSCDWSDRFVTAPLIGRLRPYGDTVMIAERISLSSAYTTHSLSGLCM